MHTRNVDDGFLYVGALLFSMIVNMFNGFAELSLAITRLPVFYKHRDLLFYPAWVFTLPNVVLRIPFSIIESIVWVLVTYYTIGFAPEADRYINTCPSRFTISVSFRNQEFVKANCGICVQVFQAPAARVLGPADGRWAFQSNCRNLQIHDHCSHWRSTISSSLLCSWRLSPAKRSITYFCPFYSPLL